MACASDDELLLASALESLDIDSYWSENSTSNENKEEIDNEYSVILQFYETLLDDMMNGSTSKNWKPIEESAVKAAMLYFVFNYDKTVNGSIPDDIDYNDLSNCFGYVHRYAGFHASLVCNVMHKVFHVSPPAPVRKILSLKDSIDVVSLGGGPGNDLVGFCSALYGKHIGLLNMNLTIIDKMTGWERIFFQTERMLRLQRLGNASALFQEIEIETFYIQADLTDRNSWTANLTKKLKNADILLLVKVLSVVPDREKGELLQGVVSLMKPGALLIYVDYPFPTVQFSIVEQWLDCVYESPKIKFCFDCEIERFGFSNITSSQAYIRIYMKKFINMLF